MQPNFATMEVIFSGTIFYFICISINVSIYCQTAMREFGLLCLQ